MLIKITLIYPNNVTYDDIAVEQIEQLIQLRYGEDGLAGEWVEFQDLPTIKPDDRTFEQQFKFNHSNEKLFSLYTII